MWSGRRTPGLTQGQVLRGRHLGEGAGSGQGESCQGREGASIQGQGLSWGPRATNALCWGSFPRGFGPSRL